MTISVWLNIALFLLLLRVVWYCLKLKGLLDKSIGLTNRCLSTLLEEIKK